MKRIKEEYLKYYPKDYNILGGIFYTLIFIIGYPLTELLEFTFKKR